MPAYLVVAYHCDECNIQMPVVGEAPWGPIAFVSAERDRHNARVHGATPICGDMEPHDPHWLIKDACGGI